MVWCSIGIQKPMFTKHPNPPPPSPLPSPPHPPPDHYQFPFEYKPTFPSLDLTYRPPDYPASYMPELSIASSFTSPIDVPQILHHLPLCIRTP
ncbi:hypothetical protein ACFX1R_029440 [Malus domestica]